MTPEEQQIKINQLKFQIEILESFTSNMTIDQIKYPLDKESIDIANKDTLISNGFLVQPANLASPYSESVQVTLNGKKYLLNTTPIFL